jgi:hypothetical protein
MKLKQYPFRTAAHFASMAWLEFDSYFVDRFLHDRSNAMRGREENGSRWCEDELSRAIMNKDLQGSAGAV